MIMSHMGEPAGRVSAFGWIATALVVYHVLIIGNLVAVAGFFIPERVHGAISLAAALSIIFLTVPALGGRGVSRDAGAPLRRPTPFDLALITCAWVSLGYIVVFHQKMLDYSMFGFLDTQGLVLALLLCLPLVEAGRRGTGVALPSP